MPVAPDDILHVMESVDAVRDRAVIEFELALADLSSLEKGLNRVKGSAKTRDKEALAELPTIEKAHESLSEGRRLWEALLDQSHLIRAGDLKATESPALDHRGDVRRYSLRR